MKHFFDVGANVGQTFDDYLFKDSAYNGWNIWCFEPSPRNLAPLLKKASDLAVTGKYNVTICPFGLWDKTGTFSFYEKDIKYWCGEYIGKENGQGDSFIKDWVINNKAPYQVIASAVDVNNFIINNTVEDDTIHIKLDCEGAEYNILQKLLEAPLVLKRIKLLLIEWHDIGKNHEKQQLLETYFKLNIPVAEWKY